MLDSRAPHWLRQLAPAAIGLAIAACAPAVLPARSASATRTDGHIVRVDGAPASDPDAYVRLVVQTEGRALVHVELAPGWYLDERGLRFSKEEPISIEGQRQEKGGEEVIVARRIHSQSATVELRDEEGRPVWTRPVGSPAQQEIRSPE